MLLATEWNSSFTGRLLHMTLIAQWWFRVEVKGQFILIPTGGREESGGLVCTKQGQA